MQGVQGGQRVDALTKRGHRATELTDLPVLDRIAVQELELHVLHLALVLLLLLLHMRRQLRARFLGDLSLLQPLLQRTDLLLRFAQVQAQVLHLCLQLLHLCAAVAVAVGTRSTGVWMCVRVCV